MQQRPHRQLLQAHDVGTVACDELDHLREERPALGRRGVAVEEVPSPHEHGHGVAYEAVRVLLADPPAFTPPYDHELAAALARAGADVELVTSRFRFGDAPEPDGYRRRELFYPLSSRVFGRSPLRLPLKVVEHPLGLAALRRLHADVLHVQWLPAPELDARLFRPHLPSVFTAHDLLPRRTAHRAELWRRIFARFDRIVVHSENGRETLAGRGVEPERLRVIPHPVFPSEPERRDDGRTVLAFGMIRPYKGLADAIEAVRRAGDARLLVAGDPLEPLDRYRAAANGLEVEWRLGYLPRPEIDRAFGDATVAVFPYRPELDQSGALLRALGAGVPAVAYDVGGIAEPVRRFEAGRVVPAGDVGGLAAALHELLADPEALERARAGARRAREELTWDAAAQAHLALYREIA
ncbi:MAG: glycosyltransferase family 4 protein [Actinobacteria bacterium]|nr:MAG: glycosyltransferase family 4 protein [Actinomycetota bacterium]